MDREKVIKALEHHKDTWVCNGCPYEDDPDIGNGKCPVYDDAIALILEQETTFIKEEDRTNHYHCEKCGYVTGIIARMHKYCPECGRKVKCE